MTLLHHDRIVAPGASPRSWLFVLAGIFGAGRNWNVVSRALVRARLLEPRRGGPEEPPEASSPPTVD